MRILEDFFKIKSSSTMRMTYSFTISSTFLFIMINRFVITMTLVHRILSTHKQWIKKSFN